MANKNAKNAKNETDFIRRGLELKSLDVTGAFSGYAAVWDDVDEADDVCLAGCFAESLKEWTQRGTLPRVKLMHFTTIGHLTLAKEDEHGLYVEGRLWDPELASQIRVDVEKAKANNQDATVGMSFAFTAVDFSFENGIRRLARVDLEDDVTITPRPVNTATEVLEVKSPEGNVPSIRDTEGILRDAGFSRSKARTLLAGGYSALCEAGSSTDVSASALAAANEVRDLLRKI